MAGMTKKLSQLLYDTQLMINNGQSHPDAAAAMAVYGYDTVRWGEGQALVDAAKAAAEANANAHAAQLGATDGINTIFDTVWAASQALASLCASLFEGQTENLTVLGLHQRRNKTTSASELAWPKSRNLITFLPWANNLYKKAATNSEISAVLATFGYPAARLTEETATLASLTQADNMQEIRKAESQHSIIARDEAIDALQRWNGQTRKVAKIALRDNRQLLELMGLRVRR